MDELFGFTVSRKDSFELKNNSEARISQEIKKNTPSPTLGSPALPRKSIQVEFSMQKVKFNLSINPKKSEKLENNGSNHMVHSMMPSLNQKKPKERFSVLNPSLNIENAINENKIRNSRTRHSSLTYSKRNKYVSSFDGKSSFLSKLIRPSESRDNKLIFLEENFGKVDTDTICPQSSLLRKKQSITEKINSDKSKFFSKQSQFKNNNEYSDRFLKIRKTSFEKKMEEENKTNQSNSDSDRENESPHTPTKESKLENHDILHVQFEEMEKRIYEFLEDERIEYVLVDQIEKYNKTLLNKKLAIQAQTKAQESPLLKRRQLMKKMDSPLVNRLNLSSCLSTDDLGKILDVDLKIK